VKALWDKLGTLYQYNSLVKKLFLRKMLYNLRMKDGELVAKHTNSFNNVVRQLFSFILKLRMKISASIYCVMYQIHGIVWLQQ